MVGKRNVERQSSTGDSLAVTTTRTLGAYFLLMLISGFFGYSICLSGSFLGIFQSISTREDRSFGDPLSTGMVREAKQLDTQQLLRSSSSTATVDPMGTAKAHTFGLLNNIPNNEWETIRLKTISTSWYANPQNPIENVNNPDLWNEKNMIPNFDCPEKEMVPKRDQKGETKHVCNPRRLAFDGKQEVGGANGVGNGVVANCLIYSFGCAGDFSFEDEIFRMHNKACEIHIFDPASAWERKDDVPNKNIHYHAWGLRSTYDDSKSVVWPKGRGGGFKTFPETMELLGHTNRVIDILKIDCEGCEWSTVNDWINLGIRQILIELHGVPSPQGTPQQRWYQKPLNLSEYYGLYQDNGYALFNKERNGELSLELCFMKMASDFWKK